MASSGTISAPVVEARVRADHDNVILMGHARIGGSATIDAGDLTLRTIKSLVVTSYDGPVRSGGPPAVFGSVTVAGSLMNSVRIRSRVGSMIPHTGTQHVGTAYVGTMKVGFLILGA